MYLHLGKNTVVNEKSVVGIFDLDNITVSTKSRDFLKKAEKKGIVFSTSEELPKSLIVCAAGGEKRMYLSQLSTTTLLKRNKALFK